RVLEQFLEESIHRGGALHQLFRSRTYPPSKFLYGDALIRKDANLSRNVHRFFSDFASAEVGIFQKSAGRSQGKGAAGTNRDDSVIGFDQISIAGNEESRFVVGNNHHRFEVP